MNFYNFNLFINQPKKFLVNYKHLMIVNDSVSNLTIYFNNKASFAIIKANETITFLDVTQVNKPLQSYNQSIPSMQLTIETDVDNSPIRIFNYGV